MEYDQNNIFFKIVNGNISTEIIDKNDSFIVINDINPKAKTHMLIISKNNYLNYYDLIKNGTIKEIHDLWKIYEELVDKYQCKNNHRIIMNCGMNQEVMHFHMHLLINK